MAVKIFFFIDFYLILLIFVPREKYRGGKPTVFPYTFYKGKSGLLDLKDRQP